MAFHGKGEVDQEVRSTWRVVRADQSILKATRSRKKLPQTATKAVLQAPALPQAFNRRHNVQPVSLLGAVKSGKILLRMPMATQPRSSPSLFPDVEISDE